MRINSEIGRLWKAVRNDPAEWWFKGFPYVVFLIAAVFRLHDGLTIAFYAAILPIFTGYTIGYLAVWYRLRDRDDAYVHFASAFCVFNLLLIYFAPINFSRIQLIGLAVGAVTGILYEMILSRRPEEQSESDKLTGIDEIVNAEIAWQKSPHREHWFTAEFKGESYQLRLNNFPEEPVCTLISKDGEQDLELFGEKWKIPLDEGD